MVQVDGAWEDPFRDRLWFPLDKFPTQWHIKDPSLPGKTLDQLTSPQKTTEASYL